MTGRSTQRQRSHVSQRGTVARRRPPQAGPVAITPARVMLLVALVGGLAFLGWSIVVRDQLQVPLMATGLTVTGLVLGAMALLAVRSVISAGREGRDGAAVVTAVFGGVLAIASLLTLAAAVIMSMIWGGTAGA